MSRLDRVVDRRGTNSLKLTHMMKHFGREDVLPMWVADMDFECSDAMKEAAHMVADWNLYGYADRESDYFEAVQSWFKRRFDWEVKPEWIAHAPGCVTAISIAIHEFTNEGDGIIIQEPVYYPFRAQVELNNRKVLNNVLVETEEGYRIDFADLREKAKEAKMMVFCSPHNPVGRVWTKEELIEIQKICLEENVLMVSDEIHFDLIRPGLTHTIAATLGEEFANNTITLTAPSKSFNMAGQQISNIIISNPKLMERYELQRETMGIHKPNNLGIQLAKAAYNGSEEWLEEVVAYIYENFEYVKNFVDERLPGVEFEIPEGTYLGWLDFRAWGYSDAKLQDFVYNKAKVGINPGYKFGKGGSGFMRLNVAASKVVVQEALERIEAAMKEMEA